ncbi:MAG: hypothetical protein KJZ64_10975 [Sphingomonadaceae bacterium]|nr:hypothetical protein [Sphingomonadaceae bacterium]
MAQEHSPAPAITLEQVTLCAVSSVNVVATVAAMKACMAQIRFARCVLFTDCDLPAPEPGIEVVRIAPLRSAAAYSEFVLLSLADFITTSHCLLVQWDGYVLDAASWQPAFLEHDYIGASWPQFDDGHDVGNGGFSLRSKRLMDLCRDRGFQFSHPEDVAIGRLNRDWLEARGMRFASTALADRFSAERRGDPAQTFGFHGVWHMPGILGRDEFWDLYRALDDRTSLGPDFIAMARSMVSGPGGGRRALRMAVDFVRDRAK